MKSKKILSCILAVVLAFSCASVAFAKYDPANKGVVNDKGHSASKIEKVFYNLTDKLIDVVGGAINSILPDQAKWGKTADDYNQDNFFAGDSAFLDEAAAGAVWSVGFGERSIIDGQDVLDGNHFVGGTLTLTKKTATSILDDLKVRAVVLDDNSGRGKVVFVVIDGFGISNPDVRDIRASLADLAKSKNIKSINIGVLHQHSAVDTLGLNGDVLKELFKNPYNNRRGLKPINGQNDAYMKNLTAKIGESVKEAIDTMKDGELYYGSVDMSEFIRDKRDPQVLDSLFRRLRFVPSDASRETWIVTSAIHCVGNGASGTVLTGDYPYYMEKEINAKYGANLAVVLGAEQGTSQDKDSLKLGNVDKATELDAYAKAMVAKLAAIDNEKKVEPILNIAHRQIKFDVKNQILLLAGKLGLATNGIVKVSNGKYQVVSEIGYMELGKDIAVCLAPGETAAEVYYGGACPADKSWTGTAWGHEPLQTLAGGKDLVVFGLMNDMVGYIIPGNDYMPILYGENSSLEIVSLGNKACDQMTAGFESLMGEVG